MKASDAIRTVLMIAVVATLGGCGVRQAGLVPSPITADAEGLKQRDLLYVSNPNGTVSVYRYWQHTLVTVLSNFTQPMGECADPAGNVYITDYQKRQIDEYAHGGTKPIKVFDGAPYTPEACSVAPSNGSLAVANYGTKFYSYYGSGNIAVYPKGGADATLYGQSSDNHFTGCAYDDRGDLFAVSQTGYSGEWYYSPKFFYLPKKSAKLVSVDLPNPYSSSGWYYEPVQGLAWDGKYWVVVSYDELYLFTINIKAQFVSRIQLGGGNGSPGPVWIYRKGFKGVGTQVVGASSNESGKGVVDYWPYPAGGDPINQITRDLDAPFGVAVSLGSSAP
jgi:hypothetical protein